MSPNYAQDTYLSTNIMDNNLHKHELAALYAIARILATRSGQREMLLEILGVLEKELQMLRGTIMILSLDGNELIVEAAGNLPSDNQQDVRYSLGEGITGTVLQTGQSAIVPKVSQEPRFCDRLHQRWLEVDGEWSFICVPISLGAEVVGTLSVDMPYEESNDLEEKKQILSIVASMLAHDIRTRRSVKLEREAFEAERTRLNNALEERYRPENIIGNSKPMRDVYTLIHQVANSDTTVLITGESGTGKELVAAAIHYSSPRAHKPFVRVNCAAMNENLLESELFGHVRGSFTGAVNDRMGHIQQADGGTLFLDEIGDFSPSTQVKLLRVLQEKEFQPVGSNQTLKVNVRVITATNRDLGKLVQSNQFRLDLYYRINVFPIHLPTLRDRKDDVLLLANNFVEKYAQKMAKNIKRITTQAINMMMAYHWPGNVRELENCIEHAVLLSSDEVIHGHNLPPTLQTPELSGTKPKGTMKTRISTLETDMIVDSLKRSHGNMAAAARELGITSRMIRYKIKNLNIDYARYFKNNFNPNE